MPHNYRCYYAPTGPFGFVATPDNGILPFVDLQAPDAETAQRKAFALKSAPIVEAFRLDPAPAAPAAPRLRRPATTPLTPPERARHARAVLAAVTARA